MKITLNVSLSLYDELTHVAIQSADSGEEWTVEGYVRECVQAGLWRDRTVRARRMQRQTEECIA